VPDGRHVAVVGRHGAGRVDPPVAGGRPVPPLEGVVQLAGADPSRLDDRGRRARIGCVPQTVDLFRGTVPDDITVGDPTVSARSTPGTHCDGAAGSRALGHSSATTTLGVYAHFWSTAEDRTRAAASDLKAAALGAAADALRTETP
jgi:hypothetical protein